MAAKNKAQKPEANEPDPRQTDVPGTEGEPTPAPVTTDELRSLFGVYEAKHQAVLAVDAQLADAKKAKSEAVRAIVERVGNKGPWTINGQRMSVTQRGDSYNMTREGESKLTL